MFKKPAALAALVTLAGVFGAAAPVAQGKATHTYTCVDATHTTYFVNLTKKETKPYKALGYTCTRDR